MPLLRSATLYPRNGTTVDTGASIDIRALLAAQTGVTEVQSVRNPTQNTSAVRTFRPGTLNVATAEAPQDTGNRYGWAVQTADMAAGDARCVAALPAQSVTLSITGVWTATGTGTTTDGFTPVIALWKYNPSTDAMTLIASGAGVEVTQSNLIAFTNVAWSGSVTLAVPATTFAAGEVLMVRVGGTLRCGPGLAGGARASAISMSSNVAGTVFTFTVGLRQVCGQNGAAACTFNAAADRNLALRRSRAAAVTLNASHARTLALRRARSAAVALNAGFARHLLLLRSYTATVTFEARARFTIAQAVLNRMAAGGVTVVKKIFPIFGD